MKHILLFAVLAVLVLCAAQLSAQGTVNGPQMYRLKGSVTKAIDSVALGTADTLRLASTKYSVVLVRGRSGTTDSITAITGGIAGGEYWFIPVADDTTITVIKGGHIYLGAANRVLDSFKDVLKLYYDGTDWFEVGFFNNN